MTLVVHLFVCLAALAFLGHAMGAEDNSYSEKIHRQVQEAISRLSSRRATDGDVDDVKRDGQVLGFGGRCGWYNDRCSAWATHCCDPWKCKYKKWTHRFSKTGGRCN